MTHTAAAAIPAFDYREQYSQMREEILAAIEGVLESGTLVLGPQVRAFEESFAAYLGGGGTAVGVASGTDALAIALRALEVGPGDEVITVANTAVPTVSAIRMVGATPVFADIDSQTLLMDLEQVAQRITPRSRAVIPVHLFGGAVDMPRLVELAARHGLAVVEDCAQSCGTTWDGRMTGTFGDVGCFSFYPTKNLGAYGDGGLCYTRHPALAEAIRSIRSYGLAAAHDAAREGVNSRLDELQAAILQVKLGRLNGFLARRRAVARVYEEHLRPQIFRPRVTAEVAHSYHLYVIAVDERDALARRLAEAGIGSGIHYPQPIHRMRGYEFLGYAAGSLPISERACGRVLSLPCYPELDHESVRRICATLNDTTCEPA